MNNHIDPSVGCHVFIVWYTRNRIAIWDQRIAISMPNRSNNFFRNITFGENSNYTLTNTPINSDQLGITLNIGFNTWNIGLYKAIRPFFNHKQKNLSSDLEQFKVGLIFYIL